MNNNLITNKIVAKYKQINLMQQTLTRSMRTQSLNQTLSQSLPKLSLNMHPSQSKLFRTNQQFAQTKKIFLDRLNNKQQQSSRRSSNTGLAGDDDSNKQVFQNRSFIQLPKQSAFQEGFTPFKTINKAESEEMLEQIRNMRSRSTLLKPFVKAEILYNKAAYQKIRIANQLKLQHEREYVNKRIKQLTPNAMNKQIKVKQKFKNKVKNVKKITLKMNYKVYQQNLNCWKPYVDFDALAFSVKQQILFIGGRKPTPCVLYNVIEDKWKQLPPINGMKCFGETDPSVVDNRKIICFGGYDYFQQGFSLITNTIKILDIKAYTFQVQQFPQTKTQCRAFHSQCIYGKFLIISGGVDKNSKLFSNFMNYNYQKKYWNQLTIQKMPDRLKLGFAKHQTLSVFHPRANYSIYDNEPTTGIDQYIKQEGIYIFGGEDANADLSSSMYIMRLGQPAIVIEEIVTSGQAPIARRNAKMLRHKDYIIIHGGRNDQMKPSVLNSMHFIHLKTLSWIKVSGEKPPYRYSHAITVVHDEIVILGGKGLQGLSKQVFILPYQQTFEYI